MIPVVYPHSINWFYRVQAHAMAADLTAVGVPARAVASDQPKGLADCGRRIALIVCFAEALVAAERQNRAELLLEALDRIDRRVLLNFDSVQSVWFTRHFDNRRDYFSDIFDFGLYRQTEQGTIRGIPYHFVPESLSTADKTDMRSWQPGRVLPWTILGHATRDRAALVEAVLRCLPKNGFVFSPPLRPFNERSGLDQTKVMRVLRATDLYIWGSHHLHPYHETQRVTQALMAGAIPVKIDPLYSHHVRLPWVYPSLEAMLRSRDQSGLDGLYATARAYIEQQGSLGGNLKTALERIGALGGASEIGMSRHDART